MNGERGDNSSKLPSPDDPPVVIPRWWACAWPAITCAPPPPRPLHGRRSASASSPCLGPPLSKGLPCCWAPAPPRRSWRPCAGETLTACPSSASRPAGAAPPSAQRWMRQAALGRTVSSGCGCRYVRDCVCVCVCVCARTRVRTHAGGGAEPAAWVVSFAWVCGQGLCWSFACAKQGNREVVRGASDIVRALQHVPAACRLYHKAPVTCTPAFMCLGASGHRPAPLVSRRSPPPPAKCAMCLGNMYTVLPIQVSTTGADDNPQRRWCRWKAYLDLEADSCALVRLSQPLTCPASQGRPPHQQQRQQHPHGRAPPERGRGRRKSKPSEPHSEATAARIRQWQVLAQINARKMRPYFHRLPQQQQQQQQRQWRRRSSGAAAGRSRAPLRLRGPVPVAAAVRMRGSGSAGPPAPARTRRGAVPAPTPVPAPVPGTNSQPGARGGGAPPPAAAAGAPTQRARHAQFMPVLDVVEGGAGDLLLQLHALLRELSAGSAQSHQPVSRSAAGPGP
jgi:hypothetical protein